MKFIENMHTFAHAGRLAMVIGCAFLLASCAKIELPKHLKPIAKDSMMLLGKKGMNQHAPIFIRVFKEESELEIWKQRADGRFYHFKSYPICTWSGTLGPKLKQGDKQAPEGFYTVNRHQMNPNSDFHLSFNLGYPNAYDRSRGRTGNFLMVHGKCTSAGCYAMTDGLIEEIYAIAREAFIGGQKKIHVHALPFRMTDEKMARHAKSPHFRFWQTLKQGYDYFELTRMPPKVAICNRRYHVNVDWRGRRPNARGACPRFTRPPVRPFWPAIGEEELAMQRITVHGIKKRTYAYRAPLDRSTMSGLGSGLSKVPGRSQQRLPKTPDLIGQLIDLSKPVSVQ